jgi:ribonuclease E
MSKLMLIDASHPEETRVVISENDRVQEYDFVTSTKNQVKGNIYLAKVTRVEPSLQAAFVEYGMGRQGFLPFAEIHPDYYQIPSADKQALMAQAEREGADDRHDAHDHGDEASENAERFDDQPEQEGDFADHLSPDHHPDPHEEHSGNARADGEGQVETFAAEEEELAPRPRRYGFLKRYKINEVIRKGQVLLIQVIKEERGNKGAALTTYISLAGRYCVLMPNTSKSSGGISRKVTNGEDRARLRDVVDSLPLAANMNVIMRTAGVDRSKAEIRRDFDYLSRLWDDIRELTMASTAPALVYEESDLIKRAIRDLYKTDIEHIVIEGEESYNSAKNFMKMLMPSHAPRVKQYKGDIPLYYAYEVEDQLLSMHDPVVRLRSGGYLVINQTEALVAIDINSGRSTRERNVEETALKTNLEAAAEIARQLRLRDLAGLLVIDFIDMYEFRHRRAVERTLKDALRTDRAKIQIGRISAFGLLEMSRQRLRPSIEETSSHPCDHCNGTGVVRSAASIAVQMLRMIEREAYDTVGGSISATSHPDVALYVLNNKRLDLLNLERKYPAAAGLFAHAPCIGCGRKLHHQ